MRSGNYCRYSDLSSEALAELELSYDGPIPKQAWDDKLRMTNPELYHQRVMESYESTIRHDKNNVLQVLMGLEVALENMRVLVEALAVHPEKRTQAQCLEVLRYSNTPESTEHFVKNGATYAIEAVKSFAERVKKTRQIEEDYRKSYDGASCTSKPERAG